MGPERPLLLSQEGQRDLELNKHLTFLQRKDSKDSSPVSGHPRHLLRPFTQLSNVVRLPSKETSCRTEVPAIARVRVGSTQSDKHGEG